MGFAGNICHMRQQTFIEKALLTGRTENTRTDVEIKFEGKAERFTTFEGLFWTASGRMDFKHCSSRVLAIDFDRDMITDFGYMGYSMTTSAYLNAWSKALWKMSFLNMRSFDRSVNPFRWTVTSRSKAPRGAGYAADMEKRFREGVPWVRTVKGDPWFWGAKYNPTLVEHYDALRHEILSEGTGWHWFTADWNARGQWAKRFINDAAKKRWEKREARRLRNLEHDRDLVTEAAFA